mgnify:CR=1 FL=1
MELINIYKSYKDEKKLLKSYKNFYGIELFFTVNTDLPWENTNTFTELYEKHLVDSHLYESNDKTYEIEFSGDTDEVIEINETIEVNNFEYKILRGINSDNCKQPHFSHKTHFWS